MSPAAYTPETVKRIAMLAKQATTPSAIAAELGWDIQRLVRTAAKHRIWLPGEAAEAVHGNVHATPSPPIVPASEAPPIAPTSEPIPPVGARRRRIPRNSKNASLRPETVYRTVAVSPFTADLLAKVAAQRDLPNGRCRIARAVVRAFLATKTLDVIIDLHCPDGRHIPISLTMPVDEFSRLDRMAADRDIATSSFCALVIEHYARQGIDVLDAMVGAI